jgi:hypothetical protein
MASAHLSPHITAPSNQALHRKTLPPLRYGKFSGELGRWAPPK